MQTNGDVLVDRGNLDATDPPGAADQPHEFALQFESAMQGIPAGQDARELSQIGIQCLS